MSDAVVISFLGPAGVRSLCNGCGLQAAKRAKERKERAYNEPTTPNEIFAELAAIGAERFKYPQGQVSHPPVSGAVLQFVWLMLVGRRLPAVCAPAPHDGANPVHTRADPGSE